MTRPVEISVVIPHYNDMTRLEKCLTALSPQLTEHPQVEALVADNNSPVDLGPLTANFPTIRFVIEPRKGAAAARNRGAAETTAPHILFLDSDCVPGPDWLAQALRYARSVPLTVFGGRVDTFDETPAPKSGAEAFETVFAFHQRSYIEAKGFSVSANLLVPRRAWEDTGEMVPGLAEDVDWCRRAVKAGFELRYADGLAVSHPTRQDWAALTKKWRRTTDEMFLTHGVSLTARTTWAVRAGIVLLSALPHSMKILRDPRLLGREKLRGLGTLFHLRATRCGWMLTQALRGGERPVPEQPLPQAGSTHRE